MKRVKLFLPLLVFVALALLFWRGLKLDPTEMPSALIGRSVPAFDLPTLEGGRATEKMLQGRAVLLNVWATWCASCRYEHPFLVELKRQGIPIIGVNYKDDQVSAKKWLRDLHNPYELNLMDADGRLGIDLGVFGAPETYLVDAKGVIRYKHVGVVDQRVWDKTLGPLYHSLLTP